MYIQLLKVRGYFMVLVGYGMRFKLTHLEEILKIGLANKVLVGYIIIPRATNKKINMAGWLSYHEYKTI